MRVLEGMEVKSTHRVEIVPVALEPHPNADTLSIVRVFTGYTVCVRTADWQARDRGAYIQPDSVVDTTRAEFAFLKTEGRDAERIKVKRLRGTISMGLLVPAPDGAQIGDDVAAQLGVTHYEPSMGLHTAGPQAPAPAGFHPTYDVESMRRYAGAFEADEPVLVTEKIHGANGRWCFVDGAMHAGSKSTWKVRDDACPWWRVLAEQPEIERFCESHPGVTLYGEIYGKVQALRYGVESGVRAVFFDVLGLDGQWMDALEGRALLESCGVPCVPMITGNMRFELDAVLALAEGPSLMPGAKHVREGVVVKPLRERRHDACGRVCLKVVGNGYMERA